MKAINPNRFTCKVASLYLDSGWGDGEFFSAEPMSDNVVSVSGTDGEAAVSVLLDNRWSVTLTTLQTGKSNTILAQLYNLKRKGASQVGFFPVLFFHNDTSEYLVSANACIARPPDVKQDKTATARAWKLLLCDAEYGFADLNAAAKALAQLVGGGG